MIKYRKIDAADILDLIKTVKVSVTQIKISFWL